MDDIEDYGGDETKLSESGYVNKTGRGVITKQKAYLEAKHSPDVDTDEVKSTVPGTQKIYVKTYGCSHNISDSEYMEGMLANYGYRITNQEDADLYLINSCTVKDPSQAAFVNLVNKGKAEGKHVVVLGRSQIVGKPATLLMVRKGTPGNATVTVCHSRTQNLAEITRQADILIAAIGKAHFVTKEMVKPGASIIDVGINRIPDASKRSGTRLVGDVDFDAVSPLCEHITPVPGGVGPMTVAMLMQNTLKAFKAMNS